MTDTSTESSGLDLQWVDPQVRPQDDLFAHVNGKWLGTHKIPDDPRKTAHSVLSTTAPKRTSAPS